MISYELVASSSLACAEMNLRFHNHVLTCNGRMLSHRWKTKQTAMINAGGSNSCSYRTCEWSHGSVTVTIHASSSWNIRGTFSVPYKASSSLRIHGTIAIAFQSTPSWWSHLGTFRVNNQASSSASDGCTNECSHCRWIQVRYRDSNSPYWWASLRPAMTKVRSLGLSRLSRPNLQFPTLRKRTMCWKKKRKYQIGPHRTNPFNKWNATRMFWLACAGCDDTSWPACHCGNVEAPIDFPEGTPPFCGLFCGDGGNGRETPFQGRFGECL